jgi:uncharacterized protein involved in response to NO
MAPAIPSGASSARGEPRFVLAAAYRPLFLAGAVHALLFVALWAALVESWRGARPVPIAARCPVAWLHAHAMLFGTFPFYVFGFLGTAFPRWVGAPPPTSRRVASWLVLLGGGQTALLLGALLAPALLVSAFALELGAFASVLAFLAGALRRATGERRLQPVLVVFAVAIGAGALALDGAGLALPDARLHFAAVTVALHGWLLLLVGGVAQRIVPFFTASWLGRPPAARPASALAVWTGLGLLRVVLSLVAEAPRAVAGLDAALSVLLVYELRAWRAGRAWREPMLAVLYVSLLWIAFALAGLAAAGLSPAHGPSFLTALRHALAIGGFATLVLGISTRVVLGHAGRPIVADAWILASFASLQLAALARVVLPWLSGVMQGPDSLAHLAALPWIAAFALWLWRMLPLLVGSPRR